jgi:hypothetical protein
MSDSLNLVKSRIKLVHDLTNLKVNFVGGDKIIEVGERGWTHPYKDYQALRFYLLLTCFDVLGQPAEWKDFNSWLAKKDNPERDEVLAKAVGLTVLEGTKILYNHYNAIYGVKNSFYRFIKEIISEQRREELLRSITIRKYCNEPYRELEYNATDDDKVKFLFTIRNSFTHKALSLASPGGGIMMYEDIEEDGIWDEEQQKQLYGEIEIFRETKAEFSLLYAVRRWPALLHEILDEEVNRLEAL